MKVLYVGKCEDGSFYHIIVTRFNVHIYRRYYNGRKWTTTRVLAGIGNVMRSLRTLPSRVRNTVRQVLDSLKDSLIVGFSKMEKNVVRLGIYMLELFREVEPYLDHVAPSKLREKVYSIVREHAEKLLREVERLELPEKVRNRILNAYVEGTLGHIIKAVETSLIEIAL